MNTMNTYYTYFFYLFIKCETSEESFGEVAAKAILGEYLSNKKKIYIIFFLHFSQ